MDPVRSRAQRTRGHCLRVTPTNREACIVDGNLRTAVANSFRNQ